MNQYERKLFERTPELATGAGKREEIGRYFHSTFDRYESLFETLSEDEAYYRKPISLRHPLIFYLGHTATFYINKLVVAGLIAQRIDADLESMFAVGVDEMSWDDLNEQHYDWPTVSQVMAYRDKVRGVVDGLIQSLPLELPIGWSHPWWIILMGIEHERIHLETSSVLIRQHDLRYVKKHPAWQPCRVSGKAPFNEMVEIAACEVALGKDRGDDYYGWDNEYGHRVAPVAAFFASRYLVSNGEFLAFVESDGYADDRYWESEGLAWRNFARAEHPEFWIRGENAWRLRIMLEEIEMPWDWPVEVNCHEASAFCRWKGALSGKAVRLPSEDEWHRLHDESGVAGVFADSRANSNIHLDHYASPCPVNTYRHNQLYDVTGNVWQWTQTPIYPYDGFEVHPCYDDFSTPTFDGRHNLIKGGSWISCGNEAQASARYAFRRHFFQHAGFRYVIADDVQPKAVPVYETDRQLSEYAEFHYGEEYFGVPNFPMTLARLAIQSMKDKPAVSALDIGCAAGRSTFELARHFDVVTGIDFSARFIDLAVRMAQQGEARYVIVDEGELVIARERTLKQFDLDDTRNRVAFFQGDACNLKPHYTAYDLIFAANLIDRLYDPEKFLGAIHERLNPGGLLLIASPYVWLAEHTQRKAWLGGYMQGEARLTTLGALRVILAPHFRPLQPPCDIPFVIRETSRKFQHTLSQVTLWERIA